MIPWIGEETTHLGLTKNARVQNCIHVILGNSTEPCKSDTVVSAATAQEEVESAKYLELWGVNAFTVTDGISTTGNMLGDNYQPIPGLSQSLMGDHGVILIMSPTKVFTVTASSDTFFDAIMEYGTGDTAERRVHFADVAVAEDMIVDLTTSSESMASLSVDTDGDGLTETEIPPTSDVGAEAMNDETPPSVEINYDQVTQLVSIIASDGSGVVKILYSTNGSTFYKYSEPFVATESVEVVFAQAEDGAGNLSSVISYNLTEQPITNKIFLPVISR